MIAFFDLDRTLISTNSATDWIRQELRLGNINRRTVVRAAGWIGLYHLGFARIESALHDGAATLTGKPEAELAARTRAFWTDQIAPTIRPGAHAVLARHRRDGAHLAMLTSSSTYLGGFAAETLGIETVLANRFIVHDGRFTGSLAEPLCFGAGKLVHAERLAAEKGVSLSDCVFYTDSYSDLPVLEAVGQPVVVHPDPRLARLARARGWPVELW